MIFKLINKQNYFCKNLTFSIALTSTTLVFSRTQWEIWIKWVANAIRYTQSCRFQWISLTLPTISVRFLRFSRGIFANHWAGNYSLGYSYLVYPITKYFFKCFSISYRLENLLRFFCNFVWLQMVPRLIPLYAFVVFSLDSHSQEKCQIY